MLQGILLFCVQIVLMNHANLQYYVKIRFDNCFLL